MGKYALEHVYMRPEVHSNRFEIANRFEMPFRFLGNLHEDLLIQNRTAIYGTIVRCMRKDVRYCFDKIMASAPGLEIRIGFLICYLQSLYKIELRQYFCPDLFCGTCN